MATIYDLIAPFGRRAEPSAFHGPDHDLLSKIAGYMQWGHAELEARRSQGQTNAEILVRRSQRMRDEHGARAQKLGATARDLVQSLYSKASTQTLHGAWAEYSRDATERAILTLDVLRKRGDMFLEHEKAGCPPVLSYAYEVVMDGADLPHPSNYMLLRIQPPEGCEVFDWKRPYIIIDPRAGHGPGIGGFKADSQVGVALRDGHPVYFVAFRRVPEPDQYLSYVTRTEAAFVHEVRRRHPNAPQPVITGNCQGGWATLLLAATNPDLTGPVVINGAPVATWAGTVGSSPMRYTAGISGGTWIPMALSDLGGGMFDGAHLVQNFELLNPSRTLFRKYTDLFADVDEAEDTFLEFERWWGGFFLLNEAEIRWIVEQLFVGNRLVKNEARLEPGRPVDLKAIRAPIIVFASHGDTITPPQQALNWIVETYADETEIRIRGQRIVYMVHKEVGHLGIFVSSKIANKEHREVASTLKTIEALAPGLYEMQIKDVSEKNGEKQFTVGFAERRMDDIRALDDGTEDERPFAAVARASEIQAHVYEAFVRPAVKAVVTPSTSEMSRALHPQRLSRALLASQNPAMAPIENAAQKTRTMRHKAARDNPFRQAEALWVDSIAQSIDLWRDTRDMMTELTFFALWSNPWARHFGQSYEAHRTLKNKDELRALPEIRQALFNLERGGFEEAVIRMLILLADNRGTVRRDRLERSSRVLTQDEPFKSLGAERRAAIIHEQTLIASYAGEEAINSLPALLPTPEMRALAVEVVRYVPGAMAEMSPQTRDLLERFQTVLGLPEFAVDIAEDPLAQPGALERLNPAARPAEKPSRRNGAAAPKTNGATAQQKSAVSRKPEAKPAKANGRAAKTVSNPLTKAAKPAPKRRGKPAPKDPT